MDGWICRPRWYIISLWASAHAIMCVQISTRACVCVRGLRVQHICYPTRTRGTGPLPVPVPDPYSKLLPDPTRTRGYTRTRHCQASQVPMNRLCSYQADRLANRHVVIV